MSVRKIAKELGVSKSWVSWVVQSTEGISQDAEQAGSVQRVPPVPERKGFRPGRVRGRLYSDGPGAEPRGDGGK